MKIESAGFKSLEGPHYVVTASVQVKLLVHYDGSIQRAALDMESPPEVTRIDFCDGVADLQSPDPKHHYSVVGEGVSAREHRIGEIIEQVAWPNIESGLL